jgi:hypothetical protein
VSNTIEIVVKVDDQASVKAAEIGQKLRALADAAQTDVTAAIGVDLEDEGLRRKVIEAVQAAERNIAVIVGIDLEDEGLREKVVEAVRRAEAGLKVVVDADVRTDKLKDKLKESAGGGIEVPIEPDATGFEEKVRREAKTAKTDPIKVPVEAETGGFEAEFRAAMAEADKAGDEAARSLRGSFSSMESGSRTLRAAMADLEPAAGGAGGAIEAAGAKAASGGSNASSAGMNFSFLHSRMVMLSGVALALAPALAAIPAAMGAVAAGGALMTFGLGGVITALKDYGAASSSAGESSAQMALTAFNDAIAIRNAEQAISDARHQAAISAQNSADSIASAQERLAGAQQTEQQATEALNQAWKDAVNTLADLNNASKDATNSVADAQLALTQAQQDAQKVVTSSLSTDLQKAEALQSVQDAQQHLTDAQQRALEAQQSADDANAKGVAGSTQVVEAQRAQVQAAQGLADAQKSLARAQQNAAEAQRQSAEQVQKAVQGLSDTYKQQQLAAAAAAASGSSAANKFAQDMAKLTPAGQALVKQLILMKGAAKELSTTAQTAMLPGLTTMLKDSGPLLPIFNQSLHDMGTVVSNVAVSFGKLFQSPAFQGNLRKILQEGAIGAQILGSAFAPLVAGLAQGAAHAGPIVQGLASGLSAIMVKGLPEFLDKVTQHSQGIGLAFQGIGTFIANLGGPLGTVAGTLASALAPAIQTLASPPVQQALQALANLLATVMTVLSPVIDDFAKGFVVALKFVTPLIESLTKFLQDNHKWLRYVADVVGVAALAFLALSSPVTLIVGAIAGLVLGLIYLWEHFKGLRDFVHDVWHDISQWAQDAVEWIIKQWDGLVDFVKKLPGRMLAVGMHIWTWAEDRWNDFTSWISGKWDSLVSDVEGLPKRMATAGAHLWDFLKDSFKESINTVIRWWDGLSFSTPSISWLGIDSHTIGMPQIPTFKAAGGPAGGMALIQGMLGGLTAIGEQGGELMKLPNGTQIWPHANTRSAIESGQAGGPVEVRIVWDGDGAPGELWAMIRKHVRVVAGGGPNSVQKAFGQ